MKIYPQQTTPSTRQTGAHLCITEVEGEKPNRYDSMTAFAFKAGSEELK